MTHAPNRPKAIDAIEAAEHTDPRLQPSERRLDGFVTRAKRLVLLWCNQLYFSLVQCVSLDLVPSLDENDKGISCPPVACDCSE